jgi:expansin (peptidoglycan-binding protein)
MLPAEVRAGLTLAIAEPWAGSSYGGAFGEACGECWEITSITETKVVMVHDLCPIEGNPVCAGSHFHVDLSTESATALAMPGIGEGRARRVPCPVTGNAHLQILDRNQWGYLRFQVLNHRLPIRTVEFRAASATTWTPAERSGGAWHVKTGGDMFMDKGEGGHFRLTSAQGESVAMPNLLTYAVAKGSFFDLGGQLSVQAATGPACSYTVPPDIYVDGYGGIERVRWIMNPWSSAKPSESANGCQAGKCLKITGMGSGAGFHVYYMHAFVPSTFKTLRVALRVETGTGTVGITLNGEGGGCQETKVALTTDWKETTLDLATVCAGRSEVSMFTVYGQGPLTLWLDNLEFGK